MDHFQWVAGLTPVVNNRMERGCTVLEVFGDVVISLGILQEFQQRVRGLLHQQGALGFLRGQRTPHDLQVLWQNIKTREAGGHIKPRGCCWQKGHNDTPKSLSITHETILRCLKTAHDSCSVQVRAKVFAQKGGWKWSDEWISQFMKG